MAELFIPGNVSRAVSDLQRIRDVLARLCLGP